MSKPTLSLISDVENAFIELCIGGSWNRHARSRLWDVLHKCLAEQPRAVLVDVADLQDPRAGSVPPLLHARRAGSQMYPPVAIVVCAPAETTAHRVFSRSAPVYGSLEEARTALNGTRPLVEYRNAMYEPDLDSVPLARDVVAEAAMSWNLTELTYPARLIVSELATNAVQHAATPYVLAASRRGRLLHLAVQDRSDAMPKLLRTRPYRPGDPVVERGFGLQMVNRMATAWGYLPTRCGKVVWATLSTRGRSMQ